MSLKNSIGLDIGTRNARAVWLALHKNDAVVERVEHIAFPADEQEAQKNLRNWLAKHGLENAFCALSLPGAQTVFQPGRVAPNDPRTPAQVAAIDIATYNEMAGDEMAYAVAHQDDPFGPGTKLTLMAMVKRATLTRALQFAEQNKIRPMDLTPAPVALFNACEPSAPQQPRRQPHVYLDIGHANTEVAIGLPTGLLFSRSLPIAGKAFTDALAQALKIPAQQAETRKHTSGLETDDPEAANALKAVAERWIAQFNGCLSVYRSTFPSKEFQPCAIKLTGGGSRLRGFSEFIAARTKLPLLPSPQNEPPAIAHGLALAMLKPPVTRLSLLPENLRDEVFFKQKKPWWIATVATLGLAFAVLFASGWYALKQSTARLDAERKKLDDRKRVHDSIEEIKKKAALVMKRSEPVRTLLGNGPLARQALTLACNSVADPHDYITLFCDIESYVPPEKPKAATGTRSVAVGAIPSGRAAAARPAQRDAKPLPPSNPAALTSYIIEGYTTNPDMTTVQKMISHLKSSPITADADLLYSDFVLAPAGSESIQKDATTLPSHTHFVIRLDIRK